MNKLQVIFLWIIAIALGWAVASIKLKQNKTAQNVTNRAPGQTLLESFPAEAVATIEIKGPAETVTLTRKDGKWTLAERDNYPVNVSFVNELLRTLTELEVTRGMKAGPSFAPRFGMDESATQPADHGLTATFKDVSSKELAKVTLGKNIESAASSSPMLGGGGSVGRYIRNHADESGFYAVSEMFPSVSAEAPRWLNNDFISLEKIKSITLSQPDKADPSWKVIREGEEAEFKLDGASADEVLNITEADPLKSIFSYARFEDVVPAAEVAERLATDGKLTATIETFEGFTYTLTIIPGKNTAGAAPSPIAPSPNSFMTVAVEATLPNERKKEDGESEEDAKIKDAAFTERLKTLTEKLAKDKALAGRTFEVNNSTVQALLKGREKLVTTAQPAATPPAGDAVRQLPGGFITPPPPTPNPERRRIQAVTPPIAIPPLDKEEDESADVEAGE